MTSANDTILIRGRISGEAAASDLRIQNGRVVSMEPASEAPADIGSADSIVTTPLFDIQVNGAFGFDLQEGAASPEGVRAITDALARWGVGYWVPTLMTASLEEMAQGCRAVAQALREDAEVRRAVPGIHLEGPFLSPHDGPRGAHSRAHIRPPRLDDFERLVEAADGQVLYVTVAPEVEGALDFIEAVANKGIVVSIGHHQADAETVAAAVDAGARMCTHLGNGLASMIHRHHNPIWPQLAEDRLACSLIADLEHLPAPMLKCLVRAKGADKVVLTSDAVHITGRPPGKYTLAGQAVELTGERIQLSGTDLLAGSALLLVQGIVNAVEAGAMTLSEACAGATTIPGALFGCEGPLTPLRPGAAANLVVFAIDPIEGRGRARIEGVFIDGERRA